MTASDPDTAYAVLHDTPAALLPWWRRIGPALLRFARRSPLSAFWACVAAAIIVVAIAAPVIAPYEPLRSDFRRMTKPPDEKNLFGTDQIGRDTLSRVIHGSRTSLIVAFAAVLIGFARAIFVVLDKGKIVDTLINGMVTPLVELPTVVFALGMTVVQAAISIAVPSTSGRAVLTMPILVPMSDLLGVSRQVTVLAYQFGAGVINHILPTDGTLMAVLALAGIRFDRWFRFAAPACAALFVLSLLAIAVAVATGLG